MNGKVDKMLEGYANLIQEHPAKVLGAAVLVSAVITAGAMNVQTEEQSQDDLLPESLPTMQAFNTISAEFSSGSGTTYTILIETNPQYANSTEIRDMRSPESLRFIEAVSKDIESMDKIRSVSGPAGLFQDGVPSSKADVKQALNTLGQERWSNQITTDYSAAKITVDSVDISSGEQTEMADLIRQTVEVHDKPAGLDVTYTGQTYINQAFQNQTGQTMAITGLAAVLGVIVVVIILFRSVFYGLTSLLTLIFGVLTGFGLFGWLGLNMSPATSGAITMGIGVAIDFGIQPIARYIEERDNFEIEKSLSETIKGVITPMTIGLIAANIGFLSLNVGRVTFLSDLGTLLTLTTTMAYISAFTVIPPALVIWDRYFTFGTGKFTLSKIKSKIHTKGETQQ